MPLFIISYKKPQFINEQFTSISLGNEFFFYFNLYKKNIMSYYRQESDFVYTTQKPIFFNKVHENSDSILEALKYSENDWSGIQLLKEANAKFKLILCSARITRSRMFFLRKNNAILFSTDLRELVPYGNKKLSMPGIYSIIKFGDTPEYLSILEDIYSIPLSSFLIINNENIRRFFLDNISILDFEMYFKLNYSHEGGNPNRTHSILNEIHSVIAHEKPIVPISGGVDSTLINCLINKYTDESYPAFHLSFGNNDEEYVFAKEAVKNTRAELEIINVKPNEFIELFMHQAGRLVQPVGESSPISMASFFMKGLHKGRSIIDGTLADGCYGSTNYNSNIFALNKKRPDWYHNFKHRLTVYNQVMLKRTDYRLYAEDPLIKDNFIAALNIYIGPYANLWFNNASGLNNAILEYWKYYYKLIPDNEADNWAKHSVFKMLNYAAKNNTAKTYDLSLYDYNVFYPFTWLSVLKDQGSYKWEEKSKNNIVKYPLKKILANYKPHEFIYRTKTGLNSCFEDWMTIGENKSFFIDYFSKSELANRIIEKKNKGIAVSLLKQSKASPEMKRLILSICMIEEWAKRNSILFDF